MPATEVLNNEEYTLLLSELFERHPSVQQSGFTKDAYKPGLEGMRGFDALLGSPSGKFPSIHIAGTNGKGSVSSMLAAALSAEGLKVGLYTSPHLVDFRERIKIISGGSFRMVPREWVSDFLKSGIIPSGLSFFEVTTGMAFRYFAEEKVNIAVIETGLGGRLDSTNILSPRLCIITSIGLDHCALLGNTRSEIASEKAGIFKPGVPAVVGSFDKETSPVFEKKAAEVHCPLFYADRMDVALPTEKADLNGPYQRENFRTTVAALNILGITPKASALSSAARITGFRGRWEHLKVDNPEIICDIGHNPAALQINFSALQGIGKPLFIVYGIMADKDLQGIIPYMPREARYYAVSPNTPRALPSGALNETLCHSGLNSRDCGSVENGVRAALSEAGKGSLVYIGGSNFVVADCISYLETTHQQ